MENRALTRKKSFQDNPLERGKDLVDGAWLTQLTGSSSSPDLRSIMRE